MSSNAVHQLKIVHNRQEKSKKQTGITGEEKNVLSENISSCLLAAVCFVIFSIPVFLYSGLKTALKKKNTTLNGAELAAPNLRQ